MARGPQFTEQLSALVPQEVQDRINALETGRPESKGDIIRHALEVGLADMESRDPTMNALAGEAIGFRFTGQISALITVAMNGRIEALSAGAPGGKSRMVREALHLGLTSVERHYARVDKA